MNSTNVDAGQNEFEDKVVTIKRVTKVVKGGRNFRFSALVVVGDKNGHVGCGIGKKQQKFQYNPARQGRCNEESVTLPLDENGSTPHDYIGKFGGTQIVFKRSGEGVGIIVGGAVRSVLELAVSKCTLKILGSNNKKNVVLTTLMGL